MNTTARHNLYRVAPAAESARKGRRLNNGEFYRVRRQVGRALSSL